ncbi:MAG: hypothetical protein DRP11_02100 [Candidatus Aenigmatarchaeota archaeon]|nr:MAG: hypothetical protein DRP11_02100 [Candidatus Aenigmarchaeota archaeon]
MDIPIAPNLFILLATLILLGISFHETRRIKAEKFLRRSLRFLLTVLLLGILSNLLLNLSVPTPFSPRLSLLHFAVLPYITLLLLYALHRSRGFTPGRILLYSFPLTALYVVSISSGSIETVEWVLGTGVNFTGVWSLFLTVLNLSFFLMFFPLAIIVSRKEEVKKKSLTLFLIVLLNSLFGILEPLIEASISHLIILPLLLAFCWIMRGYKD